MDTISNFIKKKKSITFIGMPGTGKSFTSNFFSIACINHNNYLLIQVQS